jgi:simple sugar transport system substrate-binding protein
LSIDQPTRAGNSAIDSIFALNADPIAETAVKIAKALGRVQSVRVATINMSPGFLKDIADGDAAFAIDQQGYLQGYLPVTVLALNARYGVLPVTNIGTGPRLVTKADAQKVLQLSREGLR